jgi:hypothetical protein
MYETKRRYLLCKQEDVCQGHVVYDFLWLSETMFNSFHTIKTTLSVVDLIAFHRPDFLPVTFSTSS